MRSTSSLVLLGVREQLLDRNLAVKAEFLQALVHLFEIRRLAVPSGNVFHEADAFAFHGVGDDHRRPAASDPGFFQRLNHLPHVMPIDGDDLPAEAGILLFQRLDVHDVFHPAVDLQTVAVDDADKVVEIEVAGFHGRFPDLAFLLLAVAHDAEDAVILLVELGGEREADRDAQPLAERTGGDFNARQLEPMRMALKWRVEFAEQRDVFLRAETGEGKAKIEAGRLVPGGPHDAVAVFPVGILRIVIGHAQVKRGGDVHDRERSAGVAGTSGTQGDEVIAPHQVGLFLQFVDAVVTQNFAGGRILNRHGLLLRRRCALGRRKTGA